MSIHDLGNGRWVVRWRENGQQRSRTLYSKTEASVLDHRLAHAHRSGEAISVPKLRELRSSESSSIAGSLPTLEQYFVEPYGKTKSFYDRRQSTLANNTRQLEAALWDRCVGPTIGQIPIDEIGTTDIEDWRDGLLHEHGVGVGSVERSQKIVSKLLNDAAKRGVIPYNPASGARYVRNAKRPVTPLEPIEIERIANELGEDDAFIVRLLGGTGLRPGELLGTGESPGIRWGDIRSNASATSLRVESGKTGAFREVILLEPIKSDLEIRRLFCGGDDDDLIVPDPLGNVWDQSRYRNWRKRRWKRACDAAGVRATRPYSLRHSFASMLLHEGRSIVYVARQLGNDPKVCSSTYAHVLDGLSSHSHQLSAADAIKNARSECRPSYHLDECGLPTVEAQPV